MTKLRSMTGFAQSQKDNSQGRISIEIRSVNGRFLEIRQKTPRELQTPAFDSLVKQTVGKSISRGNIDLRVEWNPTAETDRPIALDQARIDRAYAALAETAKRLKLPAPTLPELMALPGFWSETDTEKEEDQPVGLESWESSLLECLMAHQKMRELEGQAIASKLLDSAKALKKSVSQLRARRSTWEVETKARLQKRIETTLKDLAPISDEISQQKLAQEIALAVDRTDITEELNRLDGHLEHFQGVIEKDSGPHGKKLEFILQELGREANTTANKCQDLSISDQVIEIKLELERLREQVLNVE